MRIAKDSAYRSRLRVRLVAVPEQSLLTEVAFAASDVERHQHMIARLQVLDLGSDLLNEAAELVPERCADPGIRHHPMI
jgi:hypothetical protein